MPLFALHVPPRDGPCKTRGQDGVRFLLSCKALSSSTTCRFIPAHRQTGFALTPDWLTHTPDWRRVQRGLFLGLLNKLVCADAAANFGCCPGRNIRLMI